MQKGAQSFIGFGMLSGAAIVIFCVVTGSALPLLAAIGLFVVLQFTNRLDSHSGS